MHNGVNMSANKLDDEKPRGHALVFVNSMLFIYLDRACHTACLFGQMEWSVILDLTIV